MKLMKLLRNDELMSETVEKHAIKDMKFEEFLSTFRKFADTEHKLLLNTLQSIEKLINEYKNIHPNAKLWVNGFDIEDHPSAYGMTYISITIQSTMPIFEDKSIALKYGFKVREGSSRMVISLNRNF